MSSYFRINGISIEGFGPFVDKRLKFPKKTDPEKAEIHLLTGQNGSGKSTVLELFANIFGTPDMRKVRTDCYTSIEILFDNNPVYSEGNQKYKINYDPIGTISGSTHFQPVIKYSKKINSTKFNTDVQDFAMFAYSGHRQLNTATIRGINEITKSPFENALNFGSSSNPQQLIQWVANMRTKEALTFARGKNDKSKEYKKSVTRIETVISKIIDKPIEFVLEDDPLNVKIKFQGTDLDFSILPDGLKSIISWISDLLMRMDRMKWVDNIDPFKRQFILLLDEIDVHLHPAWQRQILPIVQTLFTNAQIFVSTHSPFIVGSCDNVWIHDLSESTVNITPIESEDAKSYETILKQIFGIDQRFGLEVESKLKEFSSLRNLIFSDKEISDDNRAKLLLLLDYFASQNSPEIQSIVGAEVKQIERLMETKIRL